MSTTLTQHPGSPDRHPAALRGGAHRTAGLVSGCRGHPISEPMNHSIHHPKLPALRRHRSFALVVTLSSISLRSSSQGVAMATARATGSTRATPLPVAEPVYYRDVWGRNPLANLKAEDVKRRRNEVETFILKRKTNHG